MGSNQVNQGRIGAVVIGGEHPGLGIARSLGRRGIPVCVIDDQVSVSGFSKYVIRSVRVKDLRDEQRTVDGVLEVGRRYGLEGWVLFPTRDETVAAFARNWARLAEFYRVSTAAWESVRWAWDKSNCYQRAQQIGIPVPRTYYPRTEEELHNVHNQLPLAVKPAIKEHFFYATHAKAWRAETPEQLLNLYRKAGKQIAKNEILLQEIIPGDGQTQYSYCAFFRNGRAEGKLIAKRLRQHPREFGRAATYVETTEEREIEQLAERFLRAIDYYGLVEVEFKKDPRDGQFKMLDVNARTWGFHALGAAAGVDFPYLQYADQVGEPMSVSKAKAGVGWLRFVTDLPTSIGDWFHGYLDLASYWSSLKNARVESVFASDDFMPFIAEIFMLPYFATTKFFVKSGEKREFRPTGARVPAKVSVNESW